MVQVRRFPWDGFPPVWIHASERVVKSHLSYAAGKAGDPDAAFRLVTDLLSPGIVEEIRVAVGSTLPILASAHALERGGVNAIPEVLADLLGLRLGWKVDSNIVQTNIVSHTGADGFSRLARQALFAGTVEPGSSYFLADDFIGQGGTLANLRSLILEKGGTVVGATVLTGKPYSATLAPAGETLTQLRAKHGTELETWWVRTFGFSFECLTESEARYLLNTPTVDRVRDRIAAAIEG
jgi:hypothetical protein